MSTEQINGIDLGYEASGTGQAVFFTHGYQASKKMWQPQRDGLDDAYRVITWDLRGHGSSGIPDDPDMYSHDLMIGDMGALIDHLDAEPAVLVGHSLGGYASLCFYLERPQSVRALVLVGTGPGFRDPEAREKWNSMAERFATRLDEDGLDILKRASAEVSTAEHRSASALALAARGMLAQSDSRVIDAIAEISVPTLVLIGSEDKPFIGSSQYMAKKIPGAELVTVDGGGHAANMERPEAFNAALRSFLDRL